MKPRLSNSEKKLKMINQLLHKKRKFELKRLRIQQQTPQTPPINITINTGFENNQRIKDLYKRLELLTPQEVAPRQTTEEELKQRREIRERFRKERAEGTEDRTPDIWETRSLSPQPMKRYVRSPTKRMMVNITGKAGKQRLQMDMEAGRTTNIVESRTKPDFV